MAVEMIENNELNPDLRTGVGFVNDIQIKKLVRYGGKDAFYAANGLANIFKPKVIDPIVKTVRAKYGAEINSCEQASQLLSAVQLEIDKTQKQLTTVKKKKDRVPLETEYNALVAQESRIKQNITRLKCDLIVDKEAAADFTKTLTDITGAVAGKTPVGGTNKTVLYTGVGLGVVLIGGLLVYALKS